MAALTIADFTQYYEELGDPGKPAVLMISGLGGVGASWGPQIQHFSEHFHVVLPDLTGVKYFFFRVASRNFLTFCLTRILTFSPFADRLSA